jgi:hypothetical protein
MSPETPQPEIVTATEDWAIVQEAVGHALRESLEQVRQEQLGSTICVLLVRLAFAQVVRGAMREFQAAGAEVEITGKCARI